MDAASGVSAGRRFARAAPRWRYAALREMAAGVRRHPLAHARAGRGDHVRPHDRRASAGSNHRTPDPARACACAAVGRESVVSAALFDESLPLRVRAEPVRSRSPRGRTQSIKDIMASNSVVTIERHIIDQERNYPEATGAFSNLLYDIALAAKLIAREVRSAGLFDILG